MAIGTTAAILGASAIGAGSAIVSGKQQSKAAKQSAQAYQDATDRSAEVQERIFNQIWQGGANQRALADQALSQLAASYGIRVPQSTWQPQPSSAQGQAQGSPQTMIGRPVGGDGVQRPHAVLEPLALDGRSPGTITTQPVSATQVPSGAEGTNALGPDLSGFYASPDYNFRLSEGLKGGRNALAHSGMLQSGAATKALADYQGNMALGELNNWRSGLGTIAGLGSQAFSQGAQAGTNYANALSNIWQNNAQGQASSYQNRANANTNALGGVMGSVLWGMGKMI